MFPLLAIAWRPALAESPGSTHSFAAIVGEFDCEQAPCANVLPAARRFERVEGKPYWVGLDGEERVGWVIRSTDVTDRKGYSGKPLVTLVGVDGQGRITGAEVIHHSEPILLLGIPETELKRFVGQYVGRLATDPAELGAQGENGVDAISGATVTVLAEGATILDSARALAADVGVISRVNAVPGHWSEGEPWTWSQIASSDALGRLVVTAEEMGLEPADQPFVDLWYGFVDAPQLGIPLLGERTWRWNVDRLAPGEHLFVVFNAGSASFRGSGFVRGGIFDRIRIEQGLTSLLFTDHDYTRIDSPPVADAPDLPEAGLFVARGLDPGEPFTFVFMGSAYDGKSAFSRDFHAFASTFRTPRSLWVLDGVAAEDQVWREAWSKGWPRALFVAACFSAVAGIFVARRFTTAPKERLQRLHFSVMTASFLVLGLWMHVQPSITQLLTLAGQAAHGFDGRLLLSDPVLFVSWIGIAIVSLIWGRGVFCGWICPYGSLSELLFKLGQRLGLPKLELPDRWHLRARLLRYGVLALLLGVFVWDAEAGERLAEVEPFKSTFFVPVWTRHPGLIAWWSLLLLTSLTTFRPFCRYLCPLGAALALGSSARISPPYRREFCSKCKICTRICEPRAFRPDGSIDSRECLSCMECESNWRDDQVCPPLVQTRRLRERAARAEEAA